MTAEKKEDSDLQEVARIIRESYAELKNLPGKTDAYEERALRPIDEQEDTTSYQKVLEEIQPRDHVLDIPTGRVPFLVGVAEKGGSAVGIDILPERIAFMKKHTAGVPEIRIAHGDVTQLPLVKWRFDKTTCIELLPHFTRDHMKQIIERLSNVTKPGGYLYLTMLSKDSESLNEEMTEEQLRDPEFSRQSSYYLKDSAFTPEGVKDFFEEMGFGRHQVEEIVRFKYRPNEEHLFVKIKVGRETKHGFAPQFDYTGKRKIPGRAPGEPHIKG